MASNTETVTAAYLKPLAISQTKATTPLCLHAVVGGPWLVRRLRTLRRSLSVDDIVNVHIVDDVLMPDIAPDTLGRPRDALPHR